MEMTMKTSTKFWDKIADRYSKRPISDEAAYQRKLQISRQYFEPEMDVLEFGCGTGGTAILHAPFVKHIRATDISPRMIEIAKERQSKANAGNVTFEVASIETINVPDASLNVVMGMSILHLLDDERAAIAKVYRMLKPGGVFISSTTCLGDHLKIFKYIEPIGRFLGLMPSVNVFTQDHLMRELRGAGFQIEHEWRPGKIAATFVVARKPASV